MTDEKKSICLNMIVKDEAHIILETFTNICKHVEFDYWVISDTGSTDGTQELIRNFFKEKNIPGELFEDEWKDFSHNRNKAIEHAVGKSDYVFFFDADDLIHGDFEIPGILDKDYYQAKFGTNFSYNRAIMVSNRELICRYVGVLHETLDVYKPNSTCSTIEGDYFFESRRLGNRSKNPNKYIDDGNVLAAAYEKETSDLRYRYAYYCAQSFSDSGVRMEEAIKWHKINLGLPSNMEYKYCSCINLGHLYKSLGDDEQSLLYYSKAYDHDSTRIEGITYIMDYYYSKGIHFMVNALWNKFKGYNRFTGDQKVFLDTSRYGSFEWYNIVSGYYVNDHESAYASCKVSHTNNENHSNILQNLDFYRKQLKNDKDPVLKEYLFNAIKNTRDKSLWDKYQLCIRDYSEDKWQLLNSLFTASNVTKIKENESSNKILIYTGRMNFNWNDSTLKTEPIGGAEKAVIYLSRNLPKSYDIYVAGDQIEEEFDNIKYVHRSNLQELIDENNFHTVIVSRYVCFLEHFKNIRCYKLIVSAHDSTGFINTTGISIDNILQHNNSNIDSVISLTQWHKDNIIKKHKFLNEKTVSINNGIDTTVFQNNRNNKIVNKFVWSSCAYRGLHIMLGLWSSIISKFPDATLDICSYDAFPKNDEERKMEQIINNCDSITHHGKLNTDELYVLMSKAEYWLYTNTFPETSCITAMEMLMSEVICLYYPLAGLNDTIGDYGIKVNQGEEIKELLDLTARRKTQMKKEGKEYALSCCWKNRAEEWSNVLELSKKKWIFYCSPQFETKMIQQYIDNLNYIYPGYNITLTSNKGLVLHENPCKITFVYEVFDELILNELPNSQFSFLNTEPLNIPIRLDHTTHILKIFPNFKYYDYSESNLKILEENEINIQDKIYLPYKCSDDELKRLINLNKNTKKEFDFGIVKASGGTVTERRLKIVEFLKENNFTVNIIEGWSDDRDTELAKCKIILNIHGNLGTTISLIFEHIRCDRLLKAGFNILSEESLNLDPSFINSYPNLQTTYYDNFFNIEHIIECYNNKLCTSTHNNYVLNVLQDAYRRINIHNEHINFLEKLSKDFYPENMIIYDIGSSVLHWTQNARNLWKDSTIYPFDGMTEMKLFYDEYNKQNNTNYDYNVGVLCDEDYKRISFYQNDELSGGNSYYKEIGHPDSHKIFTESNIKHKIGMKLETIVKNKNIPMPDLIKIDVQGAELDILKGSMSVINHAKFLIVELQHTEYNEGAPLCNQTRDFLIENGWQVYAEKFSNNGPDADWCFINTRCNDHNDHIESSSKQHIKKIYDELCSNKNPFDYYLNPIDIYEHLPTLYKYATQCDSILETGVRASVSSWAFVHGLINNNSENRKIILNDIDVCDIDVLLDYTNNIPNLNVSYKWINNLELNLKENIDLTFIDTWHVGGHLKKELAKFSEVTNKFIIMHDTTIDEFTSEAIRANLSEEQIQKLAIDSSMSVDDVKMGLWPAIDDFLKNNNNWVLHERFTNNNGLTILKKVNNKPKIIDCFTFYNELDMLTYRLNVLNDVVDYFVLVEATHTHVGKEKSLFYQENRQLFEKFNHKIIHIIVDDFPHKYPNINIEKDEQWINERYQRYCISRGIDKLSLQSNDVITITDLDEIPNPKILEQIKNNDIVVDVNIIEMDLYYNNLNSKMDHQWYHSKILTFQKYNELNIGCDKIRFYNCPIIRNAGWHLSYFGDVEFIKNKIENFTHQELNKVEFTDKELIKERIDNGKDLFDRPTSIINIPIEDNDNLPPDYDIYLKQFYKTHYKNIIFIHIPKTAGYAIARCLRNCNVLKDGFGFSHEIARNIIKPTHNKCIILGVIRNPYDKLYSIYEFYKKKRDIIDKNESFENFILNFEEKYYLQESQFNTCYDFLTDKLGDLMTTDIIKFENLQVEYDDFCKKYNLANNLIKMNENELKDTNINWSKLYNNNMKIIVEKIFYKDFFVFNYSYSSFLNSKNIYTL